MQINTNFLIPPPRRILGGLLTACLLMAACTQKAPEQPIEEKGCLSGLMQQTLRLDTVKSLPATETLALTGRVEYNPDHIINFVSMVSGVITQTHFTLGQTVKKGQLLAELKSNELSELLAQEKSLRSELQVASRNLTTTKRLYEDKVASEKSLIEAQSEREVLQVALENIEAQLSLFQASSEKGVFQIIAPSSGIIVQKNIVPGMQIASQGEPLFTISDRDQVWIMANVYARNIRFVKKDMEVAIKTIAYPDEEFQGKINLLAQVFDDRERVVKARIEMDNPENKLIPGMQVDIMVEKSLEKSALAVPAKALIFDDNQHYLLIYQNDCSVQARKVNPLIQNRDYAFFEQDLQEGEQIVVENQLLIFNEIKAQP